MSQNTDLELPEPARELWIRTRDILARAFADLEGGTEYSIGGGTVLAARWRHRRSYDIDIFVPATTNLKALDDDRYRWLHRALENLGVTGEYSAELNFMNLKFGDDAERGEVQVWALEPALAAGHRRERTCGRPETLLSNAQILCGKLQRSEKKLSRDVYDVFTARRLDPRALETAVGTRRRDEISAIASDWLKGRADIVKNAEMYLGKTLDEGIDYHDMAATGAFALVESRYKRFRITAEPGRIVAEAITDGKEEPRTEIAGTDANGEFSRLGLDARLDRKRPGAEAIRGYAMELCLRTKEAILVYEEHNDEPVRWRTATQSYNLDTLMPERPSAAHADGWSSGRQQERTWWSR